MSTVQSNTFRVLEREFGCMIDEWPMPARRAPGFFQFSEKHENARINRALVMAGEPGMSEGFRHRFYASFDGAASFDFTPRNWIWKAWCAGMEMDFIRLEDIAEEIAGDPVVGEAPEQVVKQAVAAGVSRKVAGPNFLKGVIDYLVQERQAFIDGETQPVGDMSTMEAEALPQLQRYDDMIAGLRERLTGDWMDESACASIRERLNAADVPGAAFIDDHVGNALWQRDQARNAIVNIHAALNVTNPKPLILKIITDLVKVKNV